TVVVHAHSVYVASVRACRLDGAGRLRRHLEPLRSRRLTGLLGGDTRVQGDRREADPAGHQPGDELWRERPAGRGHLGTAGMETEDRLVRTERVPVVEVAVGDRPTPGGQLPVEVAGDGGRPEPVPLPRR